MEKRGVKRAAVIAMRDIKWGERPLALVVLEDDEVGVISEDDIRSMSRLTLSAASSPASPFPSR